MNHKIKELAIKAGFIYDTKDCNFYGPDGINYINGEIKEFAELIIKECEKRLRFEGELGKIQAVAGPSGMYKLSYMNMAANIIKEHFGVK